jgi:hypothetical protein
MSERQSGMLRLLPNLDNLGLFYFDWRCTIFQRESQGKNYIKESLGKMFADWFGDVPEEAELAVYYAALRHRNVNCDSISIDLQRQKRGFLRFDSDLGLYVVCQRRDGA